MNKAEQRRRLRQVRTLGRRIVEAFHPQRIILFGSLAAGRSRPDSDVDLLVVARTRRPLEFAGRIHSHVGGTLPLDVVVRTPTEVSRALRSGDPFLTEVLRGGRLLYDETRHA